MASGIFALQKPTLQQALAEKTSLNVRIDIAVITRYNC